MPYYYAYTFESDIKSKYKIYDVIAKFYPNDFNNYVNLMKQSILSGNSNVRNDAENSSLLVSEILSKSIANASDSSIYNYIKTQLLIDKELIGKDPLSVLLIEFPQRVLSQNPNSDITKALSQDQLIDLMNSKIPVIESGSVNSGGSANFISPENKKISDEAFKNIILKLAAKYGSDVVLDTFSTDPKPFISPTQSAQVIIAFYEDLIGEGEVKCALIFKTLASENSNK